MKIATIIPCLGRPEETLACLKSLAEDGVPPGTVTVVENGTRENQERLQPLFPLVAFIRLPRNEGFAAACNLGARDAGRRLDPDFFFFLNNDARVGKDSLAALASALRTDSKAGLAAPKILSGEDGRIWAAGGEVAGWKLFARNRGRDQKDTGLYDRAEEMAFLSGCALMIRAEAGRSLGFFDERFFAYAEDLDLCLRARKAGWKLLYRPESVVFHKGSATAGDQYGPFQSFYRWRNRLLVFSKHARLPRKLFLYFIFFPALALRDLAVYLRKRPESIPYLWKGFLQFLSLAVLGKNPEPFRSAGGKG
ncbi:MAG: hypothetical protein A2902_04940 [Elusimicrobia bacterium RIFCSPLOWO2_01_FULL_64_13]|nr:MAG: hypothetical protein A2902_04940 [Elusimicrobia bacterium RIFCSPLOWO2_01_FULL_64_13]